MLLLTPKSGARRTIDNNIDGVIAHLISQANAHGDPKERLPQRIYSRFVAYYLDRHSSPPVDADEFYAKVSLASLPG